ncbi:MAG: HAD-IIIA family hydrolase [Candidatus Eremiobacteraeota bacterium]|nr:HAD-IIIA family hydrolase [Candidatus Eremiobacteraeota bacterium]
MSCSIVSVSSAPRNAVTHTPGRQPCVFFDRDGVFNTTDGFVNSPEDLDRQLMPQAVEALARLSRETEAKLVLVTNQGGVGYGKMTPQQAEAILERLEERVEAAGGHFDAIYYCPNRKDEQAPDGQVSARKPEAGMFYAAAHDFGSSIDLADSYMVGDMTTDIAAGENSTRDMTTILLDTGMGGKDGHANVPADQHFADLSAAVDWLIPQLKR